MHAESVQTLLASSHTGRDNEADPEAGGSHPIVVLIFFSDHRPQVYRKEAAEGAWQRCLAFFTKDLQA